MNFVIAASSFHLKHQRPGLTDVVVLDHPIIIIIIIIITVIIIIISIINSVFE